MDNNLGAIVGSLLALGLVSLFSVRTAILVSVVPGLAAVVASPTRSSKPSCRSSPERTRLRAQVRPVLRGQLGRVLAGFTAFEVGNVAATLLILRVTDVLTPAHGMATSTQIAIALYVIYNLAARRPPSTRR